MARKIIIDTDPGVDDSMAIFFALASPELDVVGLTTIFGNVHTRLATKNALRLLEIADRTDIPVAHGADNALTQPYEGPVPFVHGDDGQGNLDLPNPTTQAVDVNAAQFIIDQLRDNPGEITLVPVGPLTNIALALRMEPRITKWVDEVVLMGGNAIVPGNASPAGEANIRNDPEAADLVFGADWKVTMVGLDVTLKVIMSPEHLAEYATHNNPLSRHITKIVPFYQNFFEKSYPGSRGIFVHDSSAIAYILDPSLFTTEQWPIRVGTQGLGRGKTWPNVSKDYILPPWQDRPLVNVCVDVDGERLVNMELAYLKGV